MLHCDPLLLFLLLLHDLDLLFPLLLYVLLLLSFVLILTSMMSIQIAQAACMNYLSVFDYLKYLQIVL